MGGRRAHRADVECPILINRPIVVTPKGVRLCRPSEVVLDILPNAGIETFTNEDGVVIKAKTSGAQPTGVSILNHAGCGADFDLLPFVCPHSFHSVA
jgi:hypothetical protein